MRNAERQIPPETVKAIQTPKYQNNGVDMEESRYN